MIAGALEIQLLANIARLQQDMDKAKSVVGNTMAGIDRAAGIAAKAIGALGIGLSVGAFANMIKGAINAQDELSKMSQRIGVSVEALAGLDHAAGMSGANLDAVQKALKTVSAGLVDADRGLAASQENFDALGIAVRNSSGQLKAADAVMIEVADQFAKMKDGTEKTALATKLFGRAGLDLIPMLNEGSEGLAALVAQGQKLNPVTAESARQAELFNDNMDLLGKRVGTIGVSFANTMLPVLSDFTGRLVGSAEGMDGVGKAADTAFRYLITGIGVVGDAFRGFHLMVKGIELAFAGVATTIIKSFGLIIEGYTNLANIIPGIEVDYEETFFGRLAESTSANFERVAQEMQDLAMKEIPSHQLEAYVASVRAASNEVGDLNGQIQDATSTTETFTRVSAQEWDALVKELEGLGKQQVKDAEEAQAKVTKAHEEAQAKIVKEHERAAEQAAEEWMQFRNDLSRIFQDTLFDKDGNFFDGIKDAFNDLWKKIISDALASGVMKLLTGQGGGFSVAGSLSGAGVSGQIVSAGLSRFAPSVAGALGIGGAAAGASATSAAGYVAMMEAGGASFGAASAAGGAAAGGGMVAGMSSALAAVPVWGWAALAAGALAKVLDKSGTMSANSGMLLHDVAGASADRKFNVDAFASGFTPVGFSRRGSQQDAMDIIDVYRNYDKALTEAAKAKGLSVNFDANTFAGMGTSETGKGAGVFVGLASEDGKINSASVEAQAAEFVRLWVKGLGDQISEETRAQILGAGDANAMVAKALELSTAAKEATAALEIQTKAEKQLKDSKTALILQYATEEQRLESAKQQIRDAFGEFNVAVPTSVEELRDLVATIDPLSERGQAAMTALDGLSGSINMVVTAAERQAGLIKTKGSLLDQYGTEAQRLEAAKMQIREAFGEFGVAVPNSVQDLYALIQTIDPLSERGQEAMEALRELAPAIGLVADAADATQDRVNQILAGAFAENTPRSYREMGIPQMLMGGQGQPGTHYVNGMLHAFVNDAGKLVNVNGSHANGLDYVPFDNYIANTHKGERIQSAAQARDSDATASEVRNLRQDFADMKIALSSIVISSNKTARALDQAMKQGEGSLAVVSV